MGNNQALPYWRWFPADAMADESYAAMNFEERGFYHSCLNSAWLNSGLPADLDELAALMKVKRSWLDRVWVRVGRKWELQDGRLFNGRQEKERTHAIEKGERNRRVGNRNALKIRRDENAKETRSRSDRDANDPQHAQARADSDSDSYEGKESEENHPSRARGARRYSAAWKADNAFAKFAMDYLSTGANLIDNDFAEAYEICWKYLDFEQKLGRVAGFNQHAAEYRSAPNFVPRPLKFLQTEWERPPKLTTGSTTPERSIYKQTAVDANGNIVEVG